MHTSTLVVATRTPPARRPPASRLLPTAVVLLLAAGSSGHAIASDCCYASGGPGCDDPECQLQVCASDAFCCATSWDQLCANAANSACAICNLFDADGDGVSDGIDNCPQFFNPDQSDGDGDGVGDACDPSSCCFAWGGAECDDEACQELICQGDPLCCTELWDVPCAEAAVQLCAVCAPQPGDADADGILDGDDNCPAHFNPDQADSEGDGVGDGCDVCPLVFDPDQADSDGDGLGDQCDSCPLEFNPTQVDSDSDGICDESDNCPFDYNPVQADSDGDGLGNACDPSNCCLAWGGAGCDEQTCQNLVCQGDPSCCFALWDVSCAEAAQQGCAVCPPPPGDRDADGILDGVDNCPEKSNPDQLDSDGDGVGDGCDGCPNDSNKDAPGTCGCGFLESGLAWSQVGFGSGYIFASAAWNDPDGDGPALYAGGQWVGAPGVPGGQLLMKWDGDSWSALGSGIESSFVWSLATFDDRSGAGSALYVGGQFQEAGGIPASGIARWDGTNWAPVGSGLDNGVYAMTVFDDGSGSGPQLYAGGDFSFAGALEVSAIAKWNGATWSPVGTGISGAVLSMVAIDAGSPGGPALYVGGVIYAAGGLEANHVAKWDGESWSTLGIGVGGEDETAFVSALATFDDNSGAGPAIYAGGIFTTAGEVAAASIAKWDGASWAGVGSGLGGGLGGDIKDLIVFNDGSGDGPALFASGFLPGSGSTQGVAKWDGSSWSIIGGLSGVWTLTTFDDGSGAGPALYASGTARLQGTVCLDSDGDGTPDSEDGCPDDPGKSAPGTCGCGVSDADSDGDGTPDCDDECPENPSKTEPGLCGCEFDDGSLAWSGLGAFNGTVHAVALYDDGSGPALYVGGDFSKVGPLNVSRIAKWNGSAWSPLGVGTNGSVQALAVFDDGNGAELYVGGTFSTAGALARTRGIARWNGTTWSSLGAGLSSGAAVFALTEHRVAPGQQTALVVGGKFSAAGAVAASNIARWKDGSWAAFGSGGANGVNDTVLALRSFETSPDVLPALVAGGAFTLAGGAPASRVARWNGVAWSRMGSGFNEAVDALAVLELPSGPLLFASGYFTTSGGVATSHLARWNGTRWDATGAANGNVYALTSGLDSSGGPCLYAGGAFTTINGVPAFSRVARFNGTSWSPVGAGVNGPVFHLAFADSGVSGPPALYVGGSFTYAGGNISARGVAVWETACTPVLPTPAAPLDPE